jgi:endogenous inhibitor of DNA gyrase (YacG/DUF329 family)
VSRCPTCNEPVDAATSKLAPFCSERCKLIDLGKWLDGEFSVPGDPADVPGDQPPPKQAGDDDEL